MKIRDKVIEEILPDLFRIEIPLPGNPLKFINSYVLKGNSRFLVIDTGFNNSACRQILEPALNELDVDMEHTDFFVTHFHVDHIGLVSTLASENSIVYLGEVEASIVKRFFSPERWAAVKAAFVSNGFREEEFEMVIGNSPAFKYGLGPKLARPYTVIKDNDQLTVGDFSFTCIETPGHSPGHICLYEPRKKLLFSGDHILFDITPNIAFMPEKENPLKHYLASLEKVYNLDIALVLPGHRAGSNDLKVRINELRRHHANRLDEIVAALAEGEKTAYETTPFLHWDVAAESWDKFPIMQKYFAVSETLAHLQYLVGENTVSQRFIGDNIYYRLT